MPDTATFPSCVTPSYRPVHEDMDAVRLRETLENDQPAYIRQAEGLTQNPWAPRQGELILQCVQMFAHLPTATSENLHHGFQLAELRKPCAVC